NGGHLEHLRLFRVVIALRFPHQANLAGRRPDGSRTEPVKPSPAPGEGVLYPGLPTVGGNPKQIRKIPGALSEGVAEAHEVASRFREMVGHPPAGGHPSLSDLLMEDQTPGPL